MFKKIIAISLLAAGLTACQDNNPISSQQSTQTIRYGKSRVAFLREHDLPPGCDMWAVYGYETKPDGLRYLSYGHPQFVTICQGEVKPSKTEWREPSGKATVERQSWTFSMGGEDLE
jgi:hypothetical protein